MKIGHEKKSYKTENTVTEIGGGVGCMLVSALARVGARSLGRACARARVPARACEPMVLL